jgi:hypothetical protein
LVPGVPRAITTPREALEILRTKKWLLAALINKTGCRGGLCDRNIEYDMVSHWETMFFCRFDRDIMHDIRHDNLKGSALKNPCLVQPFLKVCYISTSKILPKGFGVVFPDSKGFGVVFPDSKGFGVVFPDSLEVLTS